MAVQVDDPNFWEKVGLTAQAEKNAAAAAQLEELRAAQVCCCIFLESTSLLNCLCFSIGARHVMC